MHLWINNVKNSKNATNLRICGKVLSMNIDVIKNNIIYHLVNDYDYRMVFSKDQKNVWLINTNQTVYKAFYMHFDNGEVFGDDVILQVVSKISMDAINSVTKITIDQEVTSSSNHVKVVTIDTLNKSVSDIQFSETFKNWSLWLNESNALTNKDIEKKMQMSIKDKIKKMRKQTAPKLSIGLIAVLVVVFLLTLLVGTQVGSMTVAALNMGALYKPYVVGLGQIWRIITAGLLHGSVFHLLMNCINLYYIGRVMEPFFAKNKWMYYVVIGVSMIAGNLVALLDTGQTITVGISGGLFGMIGYYCILCLDKGFYKNKLVRRNLMYMLLINFYVSFLPNISWQGHLGGFVAGLCFGLWNTNYPKIKPMLQHIRICIVILVIALVGIVIKDRTNYLVAPQLNESVVKMNENTIFEWMYQGLE